MGKDPPSQRHPLPFWAFYASAVALAAALFMFVRPHTGLPPLLVMAVVLALMCFDEGAPITMPSGGFANAGAVIDLPCLILIGPFYTAVLDVVSALAVQAFVLRKPMIRVVFNLANFAITDFAAGYAFRAAGGQVGHLTLMRDLGPLAACGAAYFLSNAALVSTVIGLAEGPDPYRVWQRNFQQGILHHVSFIALGALVTLTYLGIGPWGLGLFAIPALVARHSFRLYVEIRSDLKDFVRALSEVLEEIDPYTRHHSVRVSQYAVRIARGMGLREREVEEIEYAALVHDLGKIGPQHQHIIRKAGTLSREEQRTLRAHPAAGAEIVSKVRALRGASEIVRSHHERPDGKGYPFGLRARDVPVGARILNVADAFDAMTSDRPYRRALSVEAALQELGRGAGTQFDHDVVQCLLELHQNGRFPLLPSPSSEDLNMLRLRPLRVRG